MVLGIGIDIIEIDRIKRSIDDYGDIFLNKIYTNSELDYCLSKKNKFQHLAARFAAKEAIYKALESGWKKGMSWKDIEITNDKTGLPSAKIGGKLVEFFNRNAELKISMSHSTNYVTCVAIIYKANISFPE